MKKTRKYLTIGGTILAISAGGAGAALATGGGSTGDHGKNEPAGESDATVRGPGAGEATAAALKITGGGHANSVEKDSENGATWEVEVTKPDGNTVDVRLDQNDQLVVIESDSENN